MLKGYMKNENCHVVGKVLDKVFTEDVFAAGDESEVVYHLKYLYFEGNMSCDCNKRNLFGYTGEHLCGDAIEYQELNLVSNDGKVIDLLTD